MIKTQISINCSQHALWSFLSKPKYWEQWWGGSIKSVSPRWQQGATIKWGNGNTSTISRFTPEKEFSIGSQFLENIFRLMPSGDSVTTVEIEGVPRGGASFNDGGAGQKRQLNDALTKLKQLIESQPELVKAMHTGKSEKKWWQFWK